MPSLERGASGKILVRTNGVVPDGEQAERAGQFAPVGDAPSIQLLLERTEQALDPAVLPGAADLAALVTDAEESERGAKAARGEHGRVVGAQRPGLAEPADREAEMAEQRPGRDGRERLQREQPARAMINQTEDLVAASGPVPLAGEVERPDLVARTGPGPAAADLPAHLLDLMAMGPQRRGDEGLADRDTGPAGG